MPALSPFWRAVKSAIQEARPLAKAGELERKRRMPE